MQSSRLNSLFFGSFRVSVVGGDGFGQGEDEFSDREFGVFSEDLIDHFLLFVVGELGGKAIPTFHFQLAIHDHNDEVVAVRDGHIRIGVNVGKEITKLVEEIVWVDDLDVDEIDINVPNRCFHKLRKVDLNHGMNVDKVVMDLVSNMTLLPFSNGIFIDLKEALNLPIVEFFENPVFDRREITVQFVESNEHEIDVHLDSHSVHCIKCVWMISYLILSVMDKS